MNIFCKQKFPQPIIHVLFPFIRNETLVVTEKSDVVKIIVVSQVEICQKQDNHETYSYFWPFEPLAGFFSVV